MFTNVYKGLRAFITGHTGFKGSWLCAWLLNQGAQVTGFANDIPTDPSCFEILGMSERMTDLRGDVRDLHAVRAAMTDTSPHIVFHLAAQALVRASYADPVSTFQTNVMGTMNVLEAMRHCPDVRAVVIITSDKCYRNNEWAYGYRETDRLGGSDPYSASKGCAEFVAQSYFQSFFKDAPACATVRAGNVIGGGDWATDRIVPDCARAWQRGEAVVLRNPQATRPWQHVLEPLSGYLWLGSRLLGQDNPSEKGQAYNFGPMADAIHTVAQVTESLTRHWPGFSFTAVDTKDQPKECGLLKLCCDKALADLDWKATLDFEETMRYTADWYARYYAGADQESMWQFTQGQIASYVNAAQMRELAWSLA